MRMLALVLTSALLMPLSLVGQTTLGIRGGVNVRSRGGADSDGLTSPNGGYGGAYVDLTLSPRFGLQLGAAYSQKGSADQLVFDLFGNFFPNEGYIDPNSLNSSSALVLFTGVQNFGYVELPALLRVRLLPTTSRLDVHVLGGGAVSFEVSCDIDSTLTTGGNVLRMGCDDSEGERTSVFLGAVVGGGLGFGIGKGRAITVEALYNLDLTGDAEDRTFTLAVGLSMPLGRN